MNNQELSAAWRDSVLRSAKSNLLEIANELCREAVLFATAKDVVLADTDLLRIKANEIIALATTF